MKYNHFFDDFDDGRPDMVRIMNGSDSVGILSAIGEHLDFEYTEDWKQKGDPLSPFLPFSGNFKSPNIHAYFDSFLPEGKRREIIGKQDKIPASDIVGFLRRHGEDLPGNLHAEPIGKSNNSDDITKVIAKAAENGISFARFRQHSLLSGVDDKIAVVAHKKQGKWRFNLSNVENPSTHIIKKDNLLCLNELFCMRLAGKCGLSVMPCDILSFGGTEAFITERFDRVKDKTGKVLRLEQKDFCQLAGKTPNQKYYRAGFGLSNQDIAALFVPLPKSETWQFLAGSMFSLIIGNADDHGKNYAFLYAPEQKLAPLYDLASISGMLKFHPQSSGTTRLARPIGKAWQAQNLTPDDIREHLDIFDVPFSEFSDMFSELVINVEKNSELVKNDINDTLKFLSLIKLQPELDFLSEHMLGRCSEFFSDFARQLDAEARSRPKL